MEPVSGQLLAPAAPQLHTSTTWVDVLTGEHVRMELRETTLTPETDTERVRRAAATAQEEWARYRQPQAGTFTGDDAARLFGQRYGGQWKVAEPWTW